MFNPSDLLGGLLQGGGPRGHATGRLEHAMGDRGLGGAGGPLGQILGGTGGGGVGAPIGAGGLALLGMLAMNALRNAGGRQQPAASPGPIGGADADTEAAIPPEQS